jgi:hypothetical protein
MANSIETILSNVMNAEVDDAKLHALRSPEYASEAGYSEYAFTIKTMMAECTDVQRETFLENVRSYTTQNDTSENRQIYNWLIKAVHPKLNEITRKLKEAQASVARLQTEYMTILNDKKALM